MDTDFPAAHSMDTVWFAVDQAGQVGLFYSALTGPVPKAAVGYNGADMLADLYRLRHPGEADPEWVDHYQAADLGFFYFLYSDDLSFSEDIAGAVDSYDLEDAPGDRLHVDQLPPELRRICKAVCFDQVDFSKVEQLQPLQYGPCDNTDDPVAYLCDDDRTVRPVPGMEDKFAEFCRRLRRKYPEWARRLAFEAPEDKK